MGLNYDEGFQALQNLREGHAKPEIAGTNEATTRLRLIDQIFFQVLGWDRDECIAEEHYDGTYTDYSFLTPQRLLIVEAKKEGVYFELPLGVPGVRRPIPYFEKNAEDVFKAIQQAMGYCQKRGAPFGAVCNGHQLIAFVAARSDGTPPLEAEALVFDSLNSLSENFLLAWQCLSKPGIQARRLAIELRDSGTLPVPEKLSGRLSDYPGYRRRNSLQTDLQILSDIFVDDLANVSGLDDERSALEATYCESGALSQYATVSKELLKVRYSALFQERSSGPTLAPVTTREGLSQEFLAEAFSHRPILLIGDRGVGKTTFIKHLYKVDDQNIFDNAIVF